MRREENFVLINFIHSSSYPQGLLFFLPDFINLSLGTSETSSLFFDHTESKVKLRVSKNPTTLVTGVCCK